jgi:hypothetical protein
VFRITSETGTDFERERLFSSIVSLSLTDLEHVLLLESTIFAYGRLVLNHWLSEADLAAIVTPEEFKCTEPHIVLSFDSRGCEGIDVFNIVYGLFQELGALNAFHMTNEVFLNAVSER